MHDRSVKALEMAFLIVTAVWNIWKARCNNIFKQQCLDATWITYTLVSQVKEYTLKANHQRELFFLNIFNNYPFQYCLFTDASWIPNNHSSEGGFFITNDPKRIVVAGCSRIIGESAFEAKLNTLEIGLKTVADWNHNIAVIFTDCIEIQKAWNQSVYGNMGKITQRIQFCRSYIISTMLMLKLFPDFGMILPINLQPMADHVIIYLCFIKAWIYRDG